MREEEALMREEAVRQNRQEDEAMGQEGEAVLMREEEALMREEEALMREEAVKMREEVQDREEEGGRHEQRVVVEAADAVLALHEAFAGSVTPIKVKQSGLGMVTKRVASAKESKAMEAKAVKAKAVEAKATEGASTTMEVVAPSMAPSRSGVEAGQPTTCTRIAVGATMGAEAGMIAGRAPVAQRAMVTQMATMGAQGVAAAERMSAEGVGTAQRAAYGMAADRMAAAQRAAAVQGKAAVGRAAVTESAAESVVGSVAEPVEVVAADTVAVAVEGAVGVVAVETVAVAVAGAVAANTVAALEGEAEEKRTEGLPRSTTVVEKRMAAAEMAASTSRRIAAARARAALAEGRVTLDAKLVSAEATPTAGGAALVMATSKPAVAVASMALTCGASAPSTRCSAYSSVYSSICNNSISNCSGEGCASNDGTQGDPVASTSVSRPVPPEMVAAALVHQLGLCRKSLQGQAHPTHSPHHTPWSSAHAEPNVLHELPTSSLGNGRHLIATPTRARAWASSNRSSGMGKLPGESSTPANSQQGNRRRQSSRATADAACAAASKSIGGSARYRIPNELLADPIAYFRTRFTAPGVDTYPTPQR